MKLVLKNSKLAFNNFNGVEVFSGQILNVPGSGYDWKSADLSFALTTGDRFLIRIKADTNISPSGSSLYLRANAGVSSNIVEYRAGSVTDFDQWHEFEFVATRDVAVGGGLHIHIYFPDSLVTTRTFDAVLYKLD